MLASSLQMAVFPVLLLLLPHTGAAVSLMQRIRESDNLTVFTQLLTATGLDAQLDGNASCADGGPCFLVFAPSDEAFARSAGQVAGLLGQADTRLRLANQHIVTAINNGRKLLLSSWPDLERPALVGRDIGLGRARILSASSSVLYWQAKETSGIWTYHANNARINVALSNQEASNGVYHLLDDVVLPLGQDLPLLGLLNSPKDSVVKQMSVSRSLKIFMDWRSRDTEFQFLYDALLGGGGVRTAFLPTDAAWASLPPATWQRLNASAGAFRGVLTAHLALNVSLFTGWLPQGDHQAAVEFVAGHAEFKALPARLVLGGPRRDAFVAVGGVVAGVGAGGNLALRDAVVQPLDRVLAAPGYPGLAEAALSLAPGFHDLCQRFEACARLLPPTAESASGTRGGTRGGSQWTLFAPVDVAGLVGGGRDGSDAADDLEQILLLHFVPNELIPKYSMTDRLLVATEGNSSGQIRFRWSPDFTKLWVEGRLAGRGFVRSELLAWDEATLSGDLLHSIRTPLGRPELTLRQAVAGLPQLSAAAVHLDADAFLPGLGAAVAGRSFTAFVPDNRVMAAVDAFLVLRGAEAGNETSEMLAAADATRDEILRSLILPDVSIVADDVPLASKPFWYRTASIENGNQTVSLTVTAGAGSIGRTVWLQSDSLVVKASVSAGQYQCVNGILYTVESMVLHHGRAQMIVGSNAVGMATGSVTVATALATVALLSRSLQPLVH